MDGLFGQIEWPEKPERIPTRTWTRNIRMVALLCEACEEVEWHDGVKGKDMYTHMPYHYTIGGVTVDFLPHWGHYKVGTIELPTPHTIGAILMAVRAVKSLNALGFKG